LSKKLNMDKLIEAFTDNIQTGIEIANKFEFKHPTNQIDNVLICGMRGSGIGGKLVLDWVKNEIDHFILEKLDEKNLSPNEEADKERLLKRVS